MYICLCPNCFFSLCQSYSKGLTKKKYIYIYIYIYIIKRQQNQTRPAKTNICGSRDVQKESPFRFQQVVGHHHHHHVVRLARISLTLSLHVSLSFIASGRSSGLHPVSSHSCCMYVRAGCPAFDWPYAGVHRSTSLTSSSLLLQQCPACLVRLAWIVFVIGAR